MTAPELLRYHPNRFATSRDFFGTLYSEYRKCDFRYGGLISTANIQALTDRFISQYWNPKLLEVPVDRRPRNTKRMMEEFSLFSEVARFFHTGRNIFDLSRGLTALLRLTDVDDVRWESIQLPYPCFYLWFGSQAGWNLRGTESALDGAYVGQAQPPGGRILELALTTKEPETGQSAPFDYITTADPYYYFPFEIHDPASTVGDTVQETIGTSDDFNENYPRHEISPAARKLASRYGIQLNSLPRENTAQGEKVADMLHDLPIFRDALKLVVNALCYLSSPTREVDTKYPESDLTTQAAAAPSPLQRARARNRAAREGYTLIHFCGESLRNDSEEGPTGRELSAHWRRGHWRNQAIGPARADHRLMWIRPTLVRSDKAELGVPGHVYDVDRPT